VNKNYKKSIKQNIALYLIVYKHCFVGLPMSDKKERDQNFLQKLWQKIKDIAPNLADKMRTNTAIGSGVGGVRKADISPADASGAHEGVIASAIHSFPIVGDFMRGLAYTKEAYDAIKNPKTPQRKMKIATGAFGGTVSFGSGIVAALFAKSVGLLATAAAATAVPIVLAAGVAGIYAVSVARDSYEIHQLRKKIKQEKKNLDNPNNQNLKDHEENKLEKNNSNIESITEKNTSDLKKELREKSVRLATNVAITVGSSVILAGMIAATVATGGTILPVIGGAMILAGVVGRIGFLIGNAIKNRKAKSENNSAASSITEEILSDSNNYKKSTTHKISNDLGIKPNTSPNTSPTYSISSGENLLPEEKCNTYNASKNSSSTVKPSTTLNNTPPPSPSL